MKKINDTKVYTSIAPVYDYLLKHVDYQKWYSYISTIMLRTCPNPRKILEIGCGTGKFGAKFSADDFAITGMDISLDMLRIAKTRSFRNFTILCGDMKQFAFKETFDFIFCVHDTVNYLLDSSEIEAFFSSVKKSMHQETIFMFDVTTPYNIITNFDRQLNQYRSGDLFVEWSNTYDKKEQAVYSTLEVIDKKGSSRTERHMQKIYSIKEIKALCEKAGFQILHIYGDYTFKKPGRKTVMINFIVRKA